jgi:gliding motility-associated-like protein
MLTKYSYFFLIIPFFGIAQFTLYSNLHVGDDTEIYLIGPITFESGSFITEKNSVGSVVSFDGSETWLGGSHTHHIDGNAKVYNALDKFKFPLGSNGILQPLGISEPTNIDHLQVAYYHQANANVSVSTVLTKIHSGQFWAIQKATGNAKVHLPGNAFSNFDTFLGDLELSALTIVGLKNDSWEPLNSTLEIGSDILEGALITDKAIALDTYTALTFGLKGVQAGEEFTGKMPKVSEGLSPNNDGENDVWIIEGIENFPSAQIYLYNRVGEIVFQSLNGYQNDWYGDYKSTGNSLPSAPYFYTIDLDNNQKVDLQGWLYIQN